LIQTEVQVYSWSVVREIAKSTTVLR